MVESSSKSAGGDATLCCAEAAGFDRIAASHPPQRGILPWQIWSSIQEIDAARLRAALSCCIIGTLRDSLGSEAMRVQKGRH
jgi:hypothetical protein